jgi:hypothetical protein
VINWRFARIRSEVQRNCRTDFGVEPLGCPAERGARAGWLRWSG